MHVHVENLMARQKKACHVCNKVRCKSCLVALAILKVSARIGEKAPHMLMMDCSAKTVGIHIMHNLSKKKKKKKTKGMEKP